MSGYVFEAKGIVKTFPGVRALSGVDFGVHRGEVHALVGENGAGKSTLMMVLGGILQADEGEIFMEGKKMHFTSARDSIESGIGIVFQELSLVQQLSVAENIYFNRQPVNRIGMVDRKKMFDDTKKLLETFGLTDMDPAILVNTLSIADQQVIEILKAMSENPKIIVLDEPTSSLTDVEVEQLFKNINRLKSQGIGFIYITHHLSEVFEIADTVTVLRDGEKITSAKLGDINEVFLISNMVGRSIENIYGVRESRDKVGDTLFQAVGLTCSGVFENISFEIRKGEIVGFSGLVGAGRTELGRAIFGANPLDGGDMFIDGKKISTGSPERAIKQGIAYMTEDRKALGLYLDFDILQNLAANKLRKYTKRGFIRDRQVQRHCVDDIQKYSIATPSVRQKICNLSGGNQQKVMLAQWIGTEPKLLIVDEPTRGVDVGAKYEIYKTLRRLAREKQCAIMVISSDLPEILGVSDRVYIMKNGRLMGELSSQEVNEQAIMKLAAGSN